MKISSKRNALALILLLVVIYFVPLPRRIETSLHGIVATDLDKSDVTVAIRMVSLNYLIKKDKLSGSITIQFHDSAEEESFAYELTGPICFSGDKGICWNTIVRYDEKDNAMEFATVFFNKEMTQVLIIVPGLDGNIEYAAYTDEFDEESVRKNFRRVMK